MKFSLVDLIRTDDPRSYNPLLYQLSYDQFDSLYTEWGSNPRGNTPSRSWIYRLRPLGHQCLMWTSFSQLTSFYLLTRFNIIYIKIVMILRVHRFKIFNFLLTTLFWKVKLRQKERDLRALLSNIQIFRNVHFYHFL